MLLAAGSVACVGRGIGSFKIDSGELVEAEPAEPTGEFMAASKQIFSAYKYYLKFSLQLAAFLQGYHLTTQSLQNGQFLTQVSNQALRRAAFFFGGVVQIGVCSGLWR